MKLISAKTKDGKHNVIVQMDGRRSSDKAVDTFLDYIKTHNSYPHVSGKYPLKGWEIQVFQPSIGKENVFIPTLAKYEI